MYTDHDAINKGRHEDDDIDLLEHPRCKYCNRPRMHGDPHEICGGCEQAGEYYE